MSGIEKVSSRRHYELTRLTIPYEELGEKKFHVIELLEPIAKELVRMGMFYRCADDAHGYHLECDKSEWNLEEVALLLIGITMQECDGERMLN